ncbi:MAG TPA: flagellar hook-length control protein FliK, partial [Chthonomonadaceae bacterium]|nr:flagellar hook-length control protein FliK [Chthonomonadaceae bacterium]
MVTPATSLPISNLGSNEPGSSTAVMPQGTPDASPMDFATALVQAQTQHPLTPNAKPTSPTTVPSAETPESPTDAEPASSSDTTATLPGSTPTTVNGKEVTKQEDAHTPAPPTPSVTSLPPIPYAMLIVGLAQTIPVAAPKENAEGASNAQGEVPSLVTMPAPSFPPMPAQSAALGTPIANGFLQGSPALPPAITPLTGQTASATNSAPSTPAPLIPSGASMDPKAALPAASGVASAPVPLAPVPGRNADPANARAGSPLLGAQNNLSASVTTIIPATGQTGSISAAPIPTALVTNAPVTMPAPNPVTVVSQAMATGTPVQAAPIGNPAQVSASSVQPGVSVPTSASNVQPGVSVPAPASSVQPGVSVPASAESAPTQVPVPAPMAPVNPAIPAPAPVPQTTAASPIAAVPAAENRVDPTAQTVTTPTAVAVVSAPVTPSASNTVTDVDQPSEKTAGVSPALHTILSPSVVNPTGKAPAAPIPGLAYNILPKAQPAPHTQSAETAAQYLNTLERQRIVGQPSLQGTSPVRAGNTLTFAAPTLESATNGVPTTPSASAAVRPQTVPSGVTQPATGTPDAAQGTPTPATDSPTLPALTSPLELSAPVATAYTLAPVLNSLFDKQAGLTGSGKASSDGVGSVESSNPANPETSQVQAHAWSSQDSAGSGRQGDAQSREDRPSTPAQPAGAGATAVADTQRTQQTAATAPVSQEASASNNAERIRIVEQVTRHLETLRLPAGRSEMSLRLEPEHLGSLRLTITSQHDGVVARIVAESSQVQ